MKSATYARRVEKCREIVGVSTVIHGRPLYAKRFFSVLVPQGRDRSHTFGLCVRR